jgi:hypothetical protein
MLTIIVNIIMGDLIEKLSVDDTLDYSQKDVSLLKNFFDTSIITKKSPEPEKKDKNVYLFIAMITLLFFICSHPSGPSKFLPDKYKTLGSTILFSIILFIYIYFNK